MYTFAPPQQVRVNFFPFSVPKIALNEDLFNQIAAREDNIKSFRFELEGSKLKPFFDIKNKNEKQNYILFYGSNQPPFERTRE